MKDDLPKKVIYEIFDKYYLRYTKFLSLSEMLHVTKYNSEDYINEFKIELQSKVVPEILKRIPISEQRNEMDMLQYTMGFILMPPEKRSMFYEILKAMYDILTLEQKDIIDKQFEYIIDAANELGIKAKNLKESINGIL